MRAAPWGMACTERRSASVRVAKAFPDESRAGRPGIVPCLSLPAPLRVHAPRRDRARKAPLFLCQCRARSASVLRRTETVNRRPFCDVLSRFLCRRWSLAAATTTTTLSTVLRLYRLRRHMRTASYNAGEQERVCPNLRHPPGSLCGARARLGRP
ncbi:hypothetical protein BC628DRAFT_1398153 [Trametes gibbosa]|nr:hypothetical protein BC628DRAFT_1398153 [Trametes gibbosa]